MRVYDKAPTATPVEDGTGAPITLVSAGAPPLMFVNADLSAYAGPGASDMLLETGGHMLQEDGYAILLNEIGVDAVGIDISDLLLEMGDHLLQETGDALLLNMET